MTRLQKEPESYGSVWKLREAGGMHRPELDGTDRRVWNTLEATVSYKARARLTPTLTHVVTYELVTSGADGRRDVITLRLGTLPYHGQSGGPRRVR